MISFGTDKALYHLLMLIEQSKRPMVEAKYYSCHL